jgi:hypothetical protein
MKSANLFRIIRDDKALKVIAGGMCLGIRRSLIPTTALAALCGAVLLSACSGRARPAQTPSVAPKLSPAVTTAAPVSESTAPNPPTQGSTTSPPSSTAGGTDDRGYIVGTNADPSEFDPAAFAWPVSGTNQWLPLTPGYQSVRDGTINRGHRELHHRRVYTVTDVWKEIDGVRAVLVLDQDFDAGEIAEQAVDYLAQDREGNVWYMGSYTEGYQGGQFVNARDAWLAGVHGARPGVLMMSDPTEGMDAYVQAWVPGEGAPEAEVFQVGISKCVPFDCYDDVLAILEEGTEFKYYARGVGAILTEPNYSGGDQETEKLINITELSADGLAELSNEALRLDEHARSTAPGVFGGSASAQRSP